MVTHGFEIAEKRDSFVELAEEAMESFSSVVRPGSFSVDWNVVMAGAVVAALPTALIYILLGRFFIQGLLAGSVKG